MKLNLTYTKAQSKIFFETKERYQTITKGRRFGFTRGAAQFVIEELLEGRNWLWIDTINSNIQRYYERYFLPVLKQIPDLPYKWSKQDKKLMIINNYLDMRSADNPKNIEGFGYDGVILNEAGIILKDRYIWENSIRPMLIDNITSRAIIGGVPKGKNLFYELAQKGMRGDENWIHHTFTSYDNPFIDKEAIDDLIEDLNGSDDVIKQEIYGQFVDSASNELISFTALSDATKRLEVDDTGIRIWGVDPARFGTDMSVVAKRHGYKVLPLQVYNGLDTMALANRIKTIFDLDEEKPHAIFIETNGIGAGVYDACYSLGLPVIPADVSMSSAKDGFMNKRMEMYWELSQTLKYMQLPNDGLLIDDLAMVEYFYTNSGKMQLEGKKEMKKRHGRSPDRGDAVALTFYEKVYIKPEVLEFDEVYTKW